MCPWHIYCVAFHYSLYTKSRCVSLHLNPPLGEIGKWQGFSTFPHPIPVRTMVRTLDGKSEKGAHVWSALSNFYPLRYLCRSTAVANLREKTFSHAQHLLSYHLIKVPMGDNQWWKFFQHRVKTNKHVLFIHIKVWHNTWLDPDRSGRSVFGSSHGPASQSGSLFSGARQTDRILKRPLVKPHFRTFKTSSFNRSVTIIIFCIWQNSPIIGGLIQPSNWKRCLYFKYFFKYPCSG